jgi:osmotically inducible protein OsmC
MMDLQKEGVFKYGGRDGKADALFPSGVCAIFDGSSGMRARIVREASATWQGTVSRGAGVVSALSSAAFDLPVTIASRIGDPGGKTSPEELLAAAHASCFITSLGSELAKAGTPSQRLEVLCTITMDEVEEVGHRIVSSAISARGAAPGADAAAFAQAAEAADVGCPFSALIKASATVTIDATLEEGVR